MSKQREYKDAKFGFGGPKRRLKQNDAASAADMESYQPGRFNDGFSGGSRGRGGGSRAAWGRVALPSAQARLAGLRDAVASNEGCERGFGSMSS